MHDGDHDGLVRIFVGLSCQLGGLIIYLIIYITQHNFSHTRSVIITSPNETSFADARYCMLFSYSTSKHLQDLARSPEHGTP